MRSLFASLLLMLAGCAGTAPAPEAPPSADLAYLTADAARHFEGVRGIADTTQQYGYGDELSSETLYRAPLAADSAREAIVTVTTDPEGAVTATYRATFGLATSSLSFDQREERQRRRTLNESIREALLDTARAALPEWTLYDAVSSSPVLYECEGFFGRSVAITTTMDGARLEVRSGERPCLSAAQQRLFVAATDGDLDAVAQALDAGADPTLYGEGRYGSTALHIASGAGHEAIVSLLLARGADPDTRGGEGLFPLSVATAETAQLLIDAGATVTPEPGFSNTDPLGSAVVFDQLDKMRVLLDAGADPGVQSPVLDNQSPLHFAAVNASPEAVQMLLDAGADPDVATTIGYTPLLEVAGTDEPASVEIARMLIASGADVNLASNATSSYAWTPLMEAARKGNADMVRYLLTVDGVDISARSTEGLTALGAAREASEDETAALLEAAGVPE